ncbi:hypothetical protein ACSBR2_015058 [Camellia fascicularis]
MAREVARAREVGGWRSVLYGRGRREQGSVPGKSGLYTIFMDNIPLSMNPKGLYELFKKFKVVRDVFIPNKTRKTTRLRFGFVRYDCSVTAEMAVQKASGVWCGDKALRVKFADFAKDTSGVRGMGQSAEGRKEGIGVFPWKSGRGEGISSKREEYGCVVMEFLSICGVLIHLVRCKGKSYPVRVCEEHVLVPRNGVRKCSAMDCCSSNNSEVKQGSHGRPELEVVAEVEATIQNEVAIHDEVDSLCRKGVAIRDGSRGVEKLDVPSPSVVGDSFNTCMGSQKELVVCNRGISNDSIIVCQRNIIERSGEEEGLVTAGYLRSLSGNGPDRPGIKIQIVLDEAIRAKGVVKPSEVNTGVGLCSNGKDVIQAHASESSPLLSSQPISILGRAAGGSGVSHKGPVFRVVAAVLSRSSSGGQSNRGRARVTKEAKETLKVGKSLGIDFGSNEHEALQRIVELEEDDAKRVVQKDGVIHH